MHESELHELSSDEEDSYLSKKYKHEDYPETWHPFEFKYEPL